MSFYDNYDIDEKAVSEGVWLDYGDDGRIRIKPADPNLNKAYRKALEVGTRPYRRLIEAKAVSAALEKKLDKVIKEAFASAVVVTWEGVVDRQGEPMACNKENIVRLFSDLPLLWADVREAAGDVALFKRQVEEAEVKNS